MGKKTLSKLAKKKNNSKNILNCPRIDFWPIQSDEKFHEFEYNLQKCIERLDESRKSFFKIGLNNVSKSLQKSTSKILVLSDEISPKFFGRHLITLGLSNNNELIVIIVPKLKELTKKLFGISSVVLSILNLTENSFTQWCRENYDQMKFLKEYEIVQQSINSDSPITKKSSEPPEPIDITKYHLKRTNSKEFAFKVECDDAEIDATNEFGDDFISLDNNTPTMKKSKKTETKIKYKPLIIRQVHGKPK